MTATMTPADRLLTERTRDVLKRAGNPFRNYFARNPDDEVCARFHVPELFAAERDLLQAIIDLYRYDPQTHSEVVPVLGNKGAGKTHLLHSIKHGLGGQWQLLVTPGVYQRDSDFLEYLLFQIIDTLLGGGKQKGVRPLDYVGDQLVRRQLGVALRELSDDEKIELFPPPGLGRWARRLGLGTQQARERSEWLAENLSGYSNFARMPTPLPQALTEAGLPPQKAFDLVSAQVQKNEAHNTAGIMRRHIFQGFAKAALLRDESDLANFLTYGFAELEFHVRPTRQDLVLALFKVLTEVFRSLKTPVVVAFDQLEDLLLARRTDDAHRTAEAFFAGIVQAMHQIDGLCFLIFAERGLWNRFVPSLDGYIQDRLNNPVHVPKHGTVKAIRLEAPAADLVRRVVEARLRSCLGELPPGGDPVPEIFPFVDEQVMRIARTEPTLRDMLQQFRHLFDHLVYEPEDIVLPGRDGRGLQGEPVEPARLQAGSTGSPSQLVRGLQGEPVEPARLQAGSTGGGGSPSQVGRGLPGEPVEPARLSPPSTEAGSTGAGGSPSQTGKGEPVGGSPSQKVSPLKEPPGQAELDANPGSERLPELPSSRFDVVAELASLPKAPAVSLNDLELPNVDPKSRITGLLDSDNTPQLSPLPMSFKHVEMVEAPTGTPADVPPPLPATSDVVPMALAVEEPRGLKEPSLELAPTELETFPVPDSCLPDPIPCTPLLAAAAPEVPAAVSFPAPVSEYVPSPPVVKTPLSTPAAVLTGSASQIGHAALFELWEQEQRSARRKLEPEGALTGATRELQSGLGAFLGLCHEHGVKVGPWRLQHVVSEWAYGDHPTYGVVTIAHWACKDGQPWRMGLGLFLARGAGKPKDLEVKLAVLETEPAMVDLLVLLRPEDDFGTTGKSKTLLQESERRGKHTRLEPVSLDGFAQLYAFPRWLAAVREALPAGAPLPNLADAIQEKCEKLLEQVCMPVQG